MEKNKNTIKYSRTQVDIDRTPEELAEDPDLPTMMLVPKNTLYTIDDGQNIHFGIARCNDKLDRFHKSIGRDIANGRAELAQKEFKDDLGDDEVVFHSSGLRGTIRQDAVENLLNYFYTVDDFFRSVSISSYRCCCDGCEMVEECDA